jgi:hypothetical protein
MRRLTKHVAPWVREHFAVTRVGREQAAMTKTQCASRTQLALRFQH